MKRRITRKHVWQIHKHALLAACTLFVFTVLGMSLISQWMGRTLSANERALFPAYHWDRQNRLNILLIGNPITVLSYVPKHSQFISIKVPGDLQVPVGFQYGSYRLSALYSLGELEGKRQGVLLTAHTVSTLLGIPIDAYILNASMRDRDVLSELRVENVVQWGNGLKTNMEIADLAHVLFAYAFRRSDRVIQVTLEPGRGIVVDKSPDSRSQYIPDLARIDALAQEYWHDEGIIREQLRVVVKNTTKYEGLAARVARTIANMGVRVVAIENSEPKRTQTRVHGPLSYTKQKIDQFFVLGHMVEQDRTAGYNTREPSVLTAPDVRGDIVIEVGEDEWRRAH